MTRRNKIILKNAAMPIIPVGRCPPYAKYVLGDGELCVRSVAAGKVEPRAVATDARPHCNDFLNIQSVGEPN